MEWLLNTHETSGTWKEMETHRRVEVTSVLLPDMDKESVSDINDGGEFRSSFFNCFLTLNLHVPVPKGDD